MTLDIHSNDDAVLHVAEPPRSNRYGHRWTTPVLTLADGHPMLELGDGDQVTFDGLGCTIHSRSGDVVYLINNIWRERAIAEQSKLSAAERKRRAAAYNALINEGGEGYSPYGTDVDDVDATPYHKGDDKP